MASTFFLFSLYCHAIIQNGQINYLCGLLLVFRHCLGLDTVGTTNKSGGLFRHLTDFAEEYSISLQVLIGQTLKQFIGCLRLEMK